MFTCWSIHPNHDSQTPSSPEGSSVPLFRRRDIILDIVDAAAPAVVSIFVSKRSASLLSLFRSVGTGFIISPNGDIITCVHVVKGRHRIQVELKSGDNLRASLVRMDEDYDIALIHVTTSIPLPSLQFGSSAAARPGEAVLVFGCPSGLPWTVSSGILSPTRLRKGRTVLQHSCPTKGGFSGGDGEVLGVHRSHIYPGISFGVPADVLQFLNSTPADASQPRPSALASLFRSLQPACRMEESNSPMAPLDQTHGCQQLQHQFA